MPSPFPGMDPYLESPDWFPCLHDGLIFGILESLQSRLPESYYAQSTQRVWLEVSHRSVEPDVNVIAAGRRSSPWETENGGVAVADHVELAEPVVVSVESVENDPYEESFIEIRRRQGSAIRLVASIEVLSPANKTLASPGREKYLNKQRETLAGQVHLVEVDLLRGGAHTTAVPRDIAIEKAGVFDYHVCVHRFDRPGNFLVDPIRLEDCLPGIAIPLLPGDPEVALSLQDVFDRAYNAGPYRRALSYQEEAIVPPLTPGSSNGPKGAEPPRVISGYFLFGLDPRWRARLFHRCSAQVFSAIRKIPPPSATKTRSRPSQQTPSICSAG